MQRVLPHISLTLLAILAGCAGPQLDKAWPEPRPWHKEIPAYRPSREATSATLPMPELVEPSETVTLRQALALALMKNPEMASFSWEVRVQEAKTLQAGLRPNPEVEAEVEEFGGKGPRKGFRAAETTLRLSQLIELGAKRAKRKRLASLERDLAGWDYETKRLDVLTDVTKAFVDVLAAQERAALADELVHISEQVLNTVSERVRAGKVSPIEETRARVTLATSQIEREQEKRDLEIARKRLAATWGSSAPAFAKTDGQLDVPASPLPPADQLARRVARNPDLARWIVEIEKRQAVIELEKANRIPDPTLSGGIKHFNETDDNAFVAGLSLPVPLFNRNQGTLLAARYDLIKALEERRAVEVRVRRLLAEACQEIATASGQLASLKNEALPGAQSAFEALLEGYRQGKFDYLEVLEAQKTFFQTKRLYVETLATQHRAFADLERLIGEALDSADGISQLNQEDGV